MDFDFLFLFQTLLSFSVLIYFVFAIEFFHIFQRSNSPYVFSPNHLRLLVLFSFAVFSSFIFFWFSIFVPQIFPYPFLCGGFCLFTMLLTHLWWCFLFGGNFNGGSDYIYFHLLLGTFIASIGAEIEIDKLMQGGILWIAVQLTLSYFLAGFVKFKNLKWWRGEVLENLFQESSYQIPSFFKKIHSRVFFVLASSLLILFEVFFPALWIFPKLIPLFLALGVLFHLGVFWIFGLNRFFWTWVACYPALIYVISILSKTV